MAKFKFPPFIAAFLITGFDQLNSFVLQVADDEVDAAFQEVTNLLKGLVQALSDADPNDKHQVKSLLNQFLVSQSVVQLTESQIDKLVDKINNPEAEEGLSLIAKEILPLFPLLMDENPDNGKQVVDRLKHLFLGREFALYVSTTILKENLSDAIGDPDVKVYVNGIIDAVVHDGFALAAKKAGVDWK